MINPMCKSVHKLRCNLTEARPLSRLYDFAYHTSAESADIIPGRRSAFSSYPAHIISGDDFYLISSGLVAVETTVGTYNNNLYRDGISPVGSVSSTSPCSVSESVWCAFPPLPIFVTILASLEFTTTRFVGGSVQLAISHSHKLYP